MKLVRVRHFYIILFIDVQLSVGVAITLLLAHPAVIASEILKFARKL